MYEVTHIFSRDNPSNSHFREEPFGLNILLMKFDGKEKDI